MSAFHDIHRALVAVDPVPGRKLYVIAGISARLSLDTDVARGEIPRPDVIPTGMHGDVPVISTDDFPGWTVTDKPEPLNV